MLFGSNGTPCVYVPLITLDAQATVNELIVTVRDVVSLTPQLLIAVNTTVTAPFALAARTAVALAVVSEEALVNKPGVELVIVQENFTGLAVGLLPPVVVKLILLLASINTGKVAGVNVLFTTTSDIVGQLLTVTVFTQLSEPPFHVTVRGPEIVGVPVKLYVIVLVPPAGVAVGAETVDTAIVPVIPDNAISPGAGVKVSGVLPLFATTMLMVLVPSIATSFVYTPLIVLGTQLTAIELTVIVFEVVS